MRKAFTILLLRRMRNADVEVRRFSTMHSSFFIPVLLPSYNGGEQRLNADRREKRSAGMLQCHLTSRSRSGIAEGLGKLHAAIALDPSDDVVGRGIEVRPAAMTVEFEFLAIRAIAARTDFAAVF